MVLYFCGFYRCISSSGIGSWAWIGGFPPSLKFWYCSLYILTFCFTPNLIPSVQGLFNFDFLAQNAFKRKEEWSCEGCGSSLLYKTSNEIKASIPGCRLCDSCAKVCILRRVAFIVVFSSKMFQEAKLWIYAILLQLKKNKHSCGICKKIRNHLDTGSWVRHTVRNDLQLRFAIEDVYMFNCWFFLLDNNFLEFA